MKARNTNDEFQKLGAKQEVIVYHTYIQENGIERDLTKEDVITFAEKNSAFFIKDGIKYFLLLFAMPGNTRIALVEEEIELAIKDSYYGKCGKDCKRKHICHKKDKCGY